MSIRSIQSRSVLALVELLRPIVPFRGGVAVGVPLDEVVPGPHILDHALAPDLVRGRSPAVKADGGIALYEDVILYHEIPAAAHHDAPGQGLEIIIPHDSAGNGVIVIDAHGAEAHAT